MSRSEQVAELCTGQLDAHARQALAAELAEDAQALAEVVDQLAMAGMVRVSLAERDEAATAARIRHVIRLGRGSQQRRVAREVGRRLRRRRSGSRPASTIWWGLAAAAALLLLALWGRPWSRPDDEAQPQPPITILTGSVRAGDAVYRQGAKLPLGVQLSVDEAVLRLPGGGSLLCQAVELTAETGDRWRVQQGRCRIQVPPRSAEPFIVQTPHAAVTVLGTRFTVAVDMATMVTVTEGRVGVRPADGTAAQELAAGGSWSSDGRLVADFDDGLDPGWSLSGPLPQLVDGRLVLQRQRGVTAGSDGWFGHSGVLGLTPLRLPVRVRFSATLLEPHPDAILAVALHRGSDDVNGFGWVGVRGDRLLVGNGSDAIEVATVDLDRQQDWEVVIGPEDLRIRIDGAQRWRGRHEWPIQGPCQVSIGGNAKTSTPGEPLLAIDDCVLIPLR